MLQAKYVAKGYLSCKVEPTPLNILILEPQPLANSSHFHKISPNAFRKE